MKIESPTIRPEIDIILMHTANQNRISPKRIDIHNGLSFEH